MPRVDRGELFNAGVILYCHLRDFLKAKVALDPERLRALDPSADLPQIQEQLDHLVRVCDGGPAAGPIGRLPLKERFHWLVAPRSTVVQTSPVHSGMCGEPDLALERLFERMVLPPTANDPSGGEQ
jgi:hypothetical protein